MHGGLHYTRILKAAGHQHVCDLVIEKQRVPSEYHEGCHTIYESDPRQPCYGNLLASLRSTLRFTIAL
jgi:hypothetical protein